MNRSSIGKALAALRKPANMARTSEQARAAVNKRWSDYKKSRPKQSNKS